MNTKFQQVISEKREADAKALFDFLRKNISSIRRDYSLLEWNSREYQDGDYTATVMGLTEAAKDEWRKAAETLNAARGLLRLTKGMWESAEEECKELRGLLGEVLQLKGGWREAIVELEDWCHEPVRLKNMTAAADQLDAWAAKARDALAEQERESTKRGEANLNSF